MIGKIFITRSGYDPERGKLVKDPHLDGTPSLGACRPDIRKQLQTGDHIFAISGKIDGLDQFVMGGFEIASKIPAVEAYRLFPDQRLRKLEDGQLSGNIIVNSKGEHHPLDNHDSFERRVENYVVGKNLIALRTPNEILLGRKETLEALQDILERDGTKPIHVVGRWGTRLTEKQVLRLRDWLASIRKRAN